MRFLFGLVIGMAFTIAIYESVEFPSLAESVPADLRENAIDYSFYQDLYDISVTVLENFSEDEKASTSDRGPTNYFVQLGSFSKKESAEGFRAEVILEGYMTSDILVESIGDYHRVVIGPFAHKDEAELTMIWASERKLSSLLLTKRG